MKYKIPMIAALLATFVVTSCGDNIPTNTEPTEKDPTVVEPTETPSLVPSETPSEVPSLDPTKDPTVDPSLDPTKTPTEEPVVQTSIGFEAAVKLLGKAVAEEAIKSSSAKTVYFERNNALSSETEEETLLYSDLSSSSAGSVTFKENDKVQSVEKYNKRKTKTIDKIEVAGNVADYDMFVSVLDYENNDIGSRYKDDASKTYILYNEIEAENAGLEPGQYILLEQYPIFASAQVTGSLRDFIAGNLYANSYVEQTGVSTFQVAPKGNNFQYTCKVSYQYDGDYNDTITETISCSFILNETKERLLSYESSFIKSDVSNLDTTDAYVTELKNSATLKYDERIDLNPSAVINVDDYFLESISDIEILANDKFNTYVPVDANNVSLSSSYIRGQAKVYTPIKAIDLGVRCIKSSNDKVVKIDNAGYLETMGAGTTDLTFSYFGKENGIYREKTIVKTVTIVVPEVESVRILPSSSIINNTFKQGETVEIRTAVFPSKANQAVTATVDNPDVLEVSINENNNLVVKGLKGGSATITVRSVENPEISASLTLTVLGTDIDYSSKILGKTYVDDRKQLYNKTFTLKFSADGTGELIETQFKYNSETDVYTVTKEFVDKFNYTVEENIITFTKWLTNVPTSMKLETATILDENANSINAYFEITDEDSGGTTPFNYDFIAK